MPAVDAPSSDEPDRRSPILIGVIDVLQGVAVRAIAGRRSEYRPIRSRLCDSSDPCRIAAAYRDQYGVEQLYVADLDAIQGTGSNLDRIRELAAEGFRVAVDAGIRRADDADRLPETVSIVAGLETLASAEVLTTLVREYRPSRVVFSLDLAGGVPLADAGVWGCSSWTSDAPVRLIEDATEGGIEQVLVLDLHAVGTGRGPATLSLCREVGRRLPGLNLWTGGGVRTRSDVKLLTDAGVRGVVIASAFHDGTY